MNQRVHILNLGPAELESWLVDRDFPKYRTAQILNWIYQRGVTDFEAMSNLPALMRKQLAESFDIVTSTIARRAESKDGTIKLLLQWPDANTSECVLIPDEKRFTACVSSQVGCPVKCVFCASGLGGLERNLTTGEIVEQLLRVTAEVASRGGERLTNVVYMGLGEPLANFDSVRNSVLTLNAEWGIGLGARRITISTVGLPSQIRRLADEDMQVNLALSLHAPNEALRREIIPWAEKTPLRELIGSCRYYFEKTGREITLEYILLGRLNDRAEHAEQLAQVCRQLRCNVNLIRYNPVSSLPYKRPTSDDAHQFQEILRKHGVNAHVRRSRGLDIDAACGQLRRRDQMERGAEGSGTAQAVQITLPPRDSKPS